MLHASDTSSATTEVGRSFIRVVPSPRWTKASRNPVQAFTSNSRSGRSIFEPLYLLLPAEHPLAGRQHIRLADLRDERWISYHEDTDAAHCLRHICAAGGFLPEVLFRTNDYNLPYGLVRQSLGVAIAPELAVVDTSTSPDASGTRLVRLTGPTHTRRVYATRPTTDPNPFLPQAITLLHTAAAALPERVEGECPVVTG